MAKETSDGLDKTTVIYLKYSTYISEQNAGLKECFFGDQVLPNHFIITMGNTTNENKIKTSLKCHYRLNLISNLWVLKFLKKWFENSVDMRNVTTLNLVSKAYLAYFSNIAKIDWCTFMTKTFVSTGGKETKCYRTVLNGLCAKKNEM